MSIHNCFIIAKKTVITVLFAVITANSCHTRGHVQPAAKSSLNVAQLVVLKLSEATLLVSLFVLEARCDCCVFSQEAERLGDELALQRMKSLTESQRALELERKLFSSERMFRQVTNAADPEGIDHEKKSMFW